MLVLFFLRTTRRQVQRGGKNRKKLEGLSGATEKKRHASLGLTEPKPKQSSRGISDCSEECFILPSTTPASPDTPLRDTKRLS